MRRFRFLRNPDVTGVADEEAFLRRLGGPSCLYLDGEDGGRTRAFVTLLHGNEPSGVRALLRWLHSGRRPAVNAVCVVASVSAALQAPLFSHRMLPGARDLNRCFRPPFTGEQGRLAEEILEILHLHHPEAVVDMHNTSGSGPCFGVCNHRNRDHDALVSLFTRRLIVSPLGLGALMECSGDPWPVVTVEVGGRLDAAADALAAEGLARYLSSDPVLSGAGVDYPMEHFSDPVRLELNPGIALSYAERPAPEADVTLRPDLERLNFGRVGAEQVLGWARGEPRRLFRARDAAGRCAVDRLVRIEGEVLYPAGPLKLFMVTGDPDIAQADCLFYAVEATGERRK